MGIWGPQGSNDPSKGPRGSQLNFVQQKRNPKNLFEANLEKEPREGTTNKATSKIYERGSGDSLPKFMPISFFRHVSAFFEVFQDREFMKTLAASYLVLQACVSFLSCFRQEWRISVLALFA